MTPTILYKTNPTRNLKSSAYLSILPWDEEKMVEGRLYEVRLKGEFQHYAKLAQISKKRISELGDAECLLAFGKNRANSIPLLYNGHKKLNQASFVGLYLFKQTEEFPGHAGEQPGGVTDSNGAGVEGPFALTRGGNPLPEGLLYTTNPEEVKMLAIWVASAYQHALLGEDSTDMKQVAKNNQIVMAKCMAINEKIDASHGFSLIAGVNTVRGFLTRKEEIAVAKQAKLFS